MLYTLKVYLTHNTTGKQEEFEQKHDVTTLYDSLGYLHRKCVREQVIDKFVS